MNVLKKLNRKYRVKVLHHRSATPVHLFQNIWALRQCLVSQEKPLSSNTSQRFLLWPFPASFPAFQCHPCTLLLLSIISATMRLELSLPITIFCTCWGTQRGGTVSQRHSGLQTYHSLQECRKSTTLLSENFIGSLCFPLKPQTHSQQPN